MAIDSAGWAVSSAGVIDYIGDDHGGASPSYASVIELHRWLMDLSDDPLYSGDDIIDRTKPVASKRSTDFILRIKSPYTITDAAIEHLYDGSITQGAAGVDQIIWDGFVVRGNVSRVNIIQNGSKLADDFWNSNGGINPDPTQGITHRFMLKVHDFSASGGDIDGRKILATSRPWGGTWQEFQLNGTERGKNFIFLTSDSDINNQSGRAAVGALTGISNTSEGRAGIDVDGDTVSEFYYSAWTYGANSVSSLYEYAKFLSDDSSSGTLYGLDSQIFRGITHQINCDASSGGFTEAQPLAFSNGGTAQLLAVEGGATGTMWVQMLTGDAPSDGDTITQGGESATVDGPSVSVTVRAPFIGQSTGTALIASYGIGVTSVLTPSDQLTDLSGNIVSPPNVVNFTVSNLVAGDGSVTVYPWDGATLDQEGNPEIKRDQMATAAAYSGASVTSIQVDAVPGNTPDTGFLRIQRDSGIASRVAYTSHNGSDTFTISSTDFSSDPVSQGANAWVAYLDSVPSSSAETFSYTFAANTPAVVEVRDPQNQIEPFITSAVLGSNSQTVNTIRNSDA